MMTAIAISCSQAKCSCPSWNSLTDESALRSALASLDDCGSSLRAWLYVWTFLVALGVALEVVFVVWEYMEELHDFRRGIVHPPEKPKVWLFALGLLGAGLVAGGVSGELTVEAKIGNIETCIRKGNNALSLLLSKEVGDAARSARTAHEEAESARSAASTAQAKADGAGASANRARQEAKAAGESATQVGQLEAQLRRDIEADELRVAASLSGHTLWPLLFDTLKRFPPADVDILIWPTATSETRLFAEKLYVALSGFGWQISPRSPDRRTQGFVIINRWCSGKVRLKLDPSSNELDPEHVKEAEAELGLINNGDKLFEKTDRRNVDRLVVLALALEARVEKDSSLGENSLRIVIDNPDSTSQK